MASNTKNYMLNDEFPKRIKNATSSSDGLMSAEDKSRIDNLFEFGLLSPVSPDKDGIMIKEDKIKLDGIEEGANKYIHPETHKPSIIEQDENNRFVTDEQISKWNNIVIDDATSTASGLMSSTDKIKLDGIEVNANNYVHPNDSNTRHVTDQQIQNWNNKASTALVTQTAHGLMSKEDKIKLDGISSGANNYVHPNDSNTRHVTDAQIQNWNNKASTALVTTNSNGLMSSTDKIKLDGIEVNANNYVHPNDSNTRHVTDAQIAKWDSAITNIPLASQTNNGLMSATDKSKLDLLTIGDSEAGRLDTLLNRIAFIETKLQSAVFYSDGTETPDTTILTSPIDDIVVEELNDRLDILEDTLQRVIYYK